MMTEDDEKFCPSCGVSEDLHDGLDSCHAAEAKARAIEMFWGIR